MFPQMYMKGPRDSGDVPPPDPNVYLTDDEGLLLTDDEGALIVEG